MGFLVVGLGNPGPEYAPTRHNLGFQVLDRLGLPFRREGEALVARTPQGVFLKPLTYYNLAGRAVAPWVEALGLALDQVLVVHDEMDLPLGRLRFKAGGSPAGNRGVASVAEALGGLGFHRLRLGIGKPPPGITGAEYVLSPFLPEEASRVARVLDLAREAVLCWTERGLLPCADRYNGLFVE